MADKRLHKRGLTSLFTLFGFSIMAITGLVLYIVPQGRIAYWTDWRFLGLSKTDWDNIHVLASILFLVSGAFHIYFNWKPLVNYLKNKVSGGIKLKRELAITTIVSILVVVSATWQLPPLAYLNELSEAAKNAWIVTRDHEPPFGHAELLSLKGYTNRMDIDFEKAMTELENAGIEIESGDQSLEEIANNNDITPMAIHMVIKHLEETPPVDNAKTYSPEMIDLEFAGSGIGNRTVAEMSRQAGVEIQAIGKRLLGSGIEPDTNATLKQIAETHDVTPLDLLKIMLIDGYDTEDSSR